MDLNKSWDAEENIFISFIFMVIGLAFVLCCVVTTIFFILMFIVKAII